MRISTLLSALAVFAGLGAAQNVTFLTQLLQELQSLGLTSLANVSSVVNSTSTGRSLLSSLDSGPLTLFAPNNDAWAGAHPNVTSNAELLAEVLSYHVVPGSFNTTATFPNTTIGRTLLNSSDLVFLEGNKRQVLAWTNKNGTFTVLNQNTPAVVVNSTTVGNVTLRVTSAVIDVPGDLNAALSANNLTAFTSALQRASLLDTVSSTHGITVFAPSDAAFAAVQQNLTSAGSNITLLTNILKNHIINDTSVYSGTLLGLGSGSNETTAAGEGLQAHFNSSGGFVTVGNSTAEITTPDVILWNGVMHIIDNVLFDEDSNGAAASSAVSSALSAATLSTTESGPIGFTQTATGTAASGLSSSTSSSAAGSLDVPSSFTGATGPGKKSWTRGSHARRVAGSHTSTALPNGISQWLGIRYAAPPLGDLRFRAPVDPPVNDTIQVAGAHGPICFSTGVGFSEAGHSEDCLFLDVFAPSTASIASKLPVFFWIQGGGLNSLSNANYNGSELIKAADMDMVVVTHNYRVRPYGFLAGKEVQSNGDTNVGILDQRKALEWVHEHISKFGGNPEHVVLGGDSAGAQSITLHLTAFSGVATNLFHAVIAESQSFPPILTIPEAQFEYDALAERVGCANSSDSLTCLRALDVSTLQSSDIAIPFPGRSNSPNFLYNAIVDGTFLPDFPYRLFEEGRFVKVPSVFGDDTNEGTIFTPTNLNSTSDMDNFLLDNFPKLNATSLETIHRLYPESEQFSDHGSFYSNSATAYGEMRYIFPGIFISNRIRTFRNPLPNWLYHYNVEDPDQVAAGLGVPHTVEVVAIWGLLDKLHKNDEPEYAPCGWNARVDAVWWEAEDFVPRMEKIPPHQQDVAFWTA